MTDENTAVAEPVELILFPALKNDDGTPRQVKRMSLLAAYDAKIHLPLKVSDFENEAAFDRWMNLEKKDIFPALVGGKKIESLEQLRGYDPKVHRPIKPTDFTDESLLLEWKADSYEQKAKALRLEAAQLRELGSVKDRAKMKKFLQMQAKIEELAADLEATGVDVEAVREAGRLAIAGK